MKMRLFFHLSPSEKFLIPFFAQLSGFVTVFQI